MRSLAPLLLVAALAACSNSAPIRESRNAAVREAEDARQYLEELRSGKNIAPVSSVRVIDEGHYMPLRQVSDNKPAETPISCSIEYNPIRPVTLSEIGQAISENCKVAVRITPDATAAVRRRVDGGAAGQGQSQSPMQPMGQANYGGAEGLPELPVLPMQGFINGNNQADKINITWSGPISGLLDAVTAGFGLSWRHRDGVVSIFHLDTRFYRINAIPSTSEMYSQVMSGAQTSAGSTGEENAVSGASGTNQSTRVDLKTDFMKDLENAVDSMLTPGVGRKSLSRSSGGLTVTDTPENLDRVSVYIDNLNEFATKQVLINVRVLSVALTDGGEFGLNWSAVYKNLAEQYGFRITNALQSASDAISGSINILQGSDSRFAGSDLVVKALAEEGRVSVLTQPSVTTLNLEPVPVQVARQVSYLERVELGQTAQVGSTTSLTPGSVTTGFNMMLLPHILDDSETVLLQYSMNLSSLDNLRTVSSGGATIEIPEIDNRIFNQKVRLKSNETLIISGFEQLGTDSRRTGVGDAGWWLFGGGARGQKRRDVIVVLITPVVMG